MNLYQILVNHNGRINQIIMLSGQWPRTPSIKKAIRDAAIRENTFPSCVRRFWNTLPDVDLSYADYKGTNTVVYKNVTVKRITVYHKGNWSCKLSCDIPTSSSRRRV